MLFIVWLFFLLQKIIDYQVFVVISQLSCIILALLLISNDFENFPFFGAVKNSWKKNRRFCKVSQGIDLFQILLKLCSFIILFFLNTCVKFKNYWPSRMRENCHGKKLKKRLITEFPILRENWTTFSITVNKYSISLQSNFFLRLKAVSQFISQN